MFMYYCENKNGNEILFDDEITDVVYDVENNLKNDKMFVVGSFEAVDSSKSKSRYQLICNVKTDEFFNELQTLKQVGNYKKLILVPQVDDLLTLSELYANLNDDVEYELVGVVIEDIDPTRPYILFVKNIKSSDLINMINKVTELLKTDLKPTEIISFVEKFNKKFVLIYNNNVLHNCKTEISSLTNYKVTKINL